MNRERELAKLLRSIIEIAELVRNIENRVIELIEIERREAKS